MTRRAQPFRVLIVDDEPLSRDAIRALASSDPELEIAGECSGVDANALIESLQPDIVFLDIQMPEVDGFEVLSRAGAGSVGAVIFVTAYDQFALRAFEVHALDYLLKPFSDERFRDAVERAKRSIGSTQDHELQARIAALLSERKTSTAARILVPVRDRTIVLNVSDIDWIEAADYYISLHVGGASYLLRESMDEIERRLDPAKFVRIHRSTIVNVDRVREIHPLFRGDCAVVLHDGSKHRLTRHRRKEFEALFGR